MAQLKMDPPAAGAAAAPSPREVIIAALSKGLDGGMSGAAAMTIQVETSVSRNTVFVIEKNAGVWQNLERYCQF